MERSNGLDRSKNQPTKPTSTPGGLDESLECVPVARRELSTVLPPPVPIVERLAHYLDRLESMVDDRSMIDLGFGFTNADIRSDLNAFNAERGVGGVQAARYQSFSTVSAAKGVDESLETAPVARRESTTVLPPPVTLVDILQNEPLEALKVLESHIRRTVVHKDGSCTMEMDFRNEEDARAASMAARAAVTMAEKQIANPLNSAAPNLLRQLRYLVDMHDRGCHIPNLDDARAAIAQVDGCSPVVTSEIDTILSEMEPD